MAAFPQPSEGGAVGKDFVQYEGQAQPSVV